MGINYQEIVENLRDEDVFNLLGQLGAEPIDKGDYFLCRTICHHALDEESKYKLYYYKNTHLFYCYSRCGALSIFKLLKEYYDVNEIEYDWYHDIYEVIKNCSLAAEVHTNNRYKSIRDDFKLKKERRKLPIVNEGIMNCFIKYYTPEWLHDGITSAAMDKYNIRYSISQNKIIIPHYDADGGLVGIRGRALNVDECEQFGKYMPVQLENKWYSHPLSLNVYGLNWNKDNIKSTGICYICESEKSALQAENFSTPNCVVASCGSNLNKFQIDLIIRYGRPREIVVCYDNEEEPDSEVYFNKLYKMCSKYKNYCNMSFVYDRKGLTKQKDSPTDKGEEIFRQLIQERIKI